MLILYAERDEDWRRQQNVEVAAAMKAAGHKNVEIVDDPQSQSRDNLVERRRRRVMKPPSTSFDSCHAEAAADAVVVLFRRERRKTVINSSSVSRLSSAMVVVALCLTVLPAEAQKYVAPRTPWGDPDLEGLWSNQTSTPLERPDALRDAATLTPEEAEEREEAARLSADRPPARGRSGNL